MSRPSPSNGDANDGDPTIHDGSETRHTAILTEQNPIAIIDRLPQTVFPVECRFSITRTKTKDTEDATYREPQYPVSLHKSTGVYVPETTVHFDNPAKRPPDGEPVWQPTTFAERVTDLLDHADTLTAEDISLRRFTVVEVPPHLVTTDSKTGAPAAKPELYSEENTMTIARFRKHNSLAASAVRNDLPDALAGESRTPVRLTDLISVTAKPSRHGRHTTASAGRAQYYTERDADQANDISKTPAHYQSRYLNNQGERTRPLAPTLRSLDKFTPDLIQSTDDLVNVVKFVGHERERTDFVAEEVRE